MKFNFNSFKESLKKDNASKIIAFIFAVIIWLIVTISLYPDTTITIKDIDVQINLSDTYVNEMGLNVVSGQGQKVTAKIKGNRSEIGSLNASDFTASVNLEDIKTASEYDLDVIVTPNDSSIKYELVDVSPSKIKVKFDNVISKTFEIEPQTSAIIPDEYVMGTLECSPNTVKITGPEQVIEKINSCVAFATAGTVSETKAIKADLILYDNEKNIIDGKDLSFSVSEINVTVPVYQKKKVPFDIVYRNVPPQFDTKQLQYRLSSDEIEIAATSETISKIDKISLSYIDFRELELGASFTLNVVLPSGIQNISGIETVEVSYPMDNFDSKVFTVSNINLLNAPSNFDITLLTNKLQRVNIIAPKAVLNELTVKDIVAQIDLSAVTVTEGTQSVSVDVYIDGVGPAWAIGEYSATITAHSK